MMSTKKLMVCLGNFRRPILEQGILKSKVISKAYIDSTITLGYHLVNNPFEDSKYYQNLKK